MERFCKVGQPMRLKANNYFSPPLGTTIFSFAIVFTDRGRSLPISSLAECGTAISA